MPSRLRSGSFLKYATSVSDINDEIKAPFNAEASHEYCDRQESHILQ